MISFPHAKINIGLYVTRKRSDGFHDIETVMMPVKGLHDILEILPQEDNSSSFVFTQTGLLVDSPNENNLCVRAYELIKKHVEIPSVLMHLHKQIPMGAGLGGGSSNGAFVLKMLNGLAKSKISEEQLAGLALKLGSDCPFFLKEQPCLAEGRGEVLQPLALNLSGNFIAIVHPGIHVNTGQAYGLISPSKPNVNLKELPLIPLEQWREQVRNVFEEALFPLHPEIEKLKALMYAMGAMYASMTGSGSSVFGIFRNKPNLEQIPDGYFKHVSEL